MIQERALQSAITRLRSSGASVVDHLTAQRVALDAVRLAIPTDVGVFATVDPATSLWTSCVLHNLDHDPHREAAMFENEYSQQDVLKIATIARRTLPAGRLSELSPTERSSSARDQVLRASGIVDELRCALISDGACWGSFVLYRSADAGPFTPEDVESAGQLVSPLSYFIRLALLRQAAMVPNSLEDPPGVVLFGTDGTIEARSPGTERWFEEIEPGVRVPVLIRTMALKTLASERGSISTVTPRASGGWLRLHATRLESDDCKKVSIALEPLKTPALPETVASVYGFTPREREIIKWMARGLSAKEIGVELGISVYTVNDHSKSVFRKAGVQSRQQLIALLFFSHCLPLREKGAMPSPYGWFLMMD